MRVKREGQRLIQFGGQRELPRTMTGLPTAAMRFIVEDMLLVSKAHRIPVSVLADQAEYFWVSAIEDGRAGDFLHLLPESEARFKQVRSHAHAGWKTAVWMDDEDLPIGLGVLTEGVSPEAR